MNCDTRVGDFLQDVQSLIRDGWRCNVDLNKPVNRDYCDKIGMPYQSAGFEVRAVILDLGIDDWHSGPNLDQYRKCTDHFYEFKGLHYGKKVFLRFKIDRERRTIYVNSFHDDRQHIFLLQGLHR